MSAITLLCTYRRSVPFSLTAISSACQAFTARTELLNDLTPLVRSTTVPRPSMPSSRVMSDFHWSTSTGTRRGHSSGGVHSAPSRPNNDLMDKLSTESFRSSALCDDVKPILLISSSLGLREVTGFVYCHVGLTRAFGTLATVKNLFLIKIAIIVKIIIGLPPRVNGIRRRGSANTRR